MLRNNDWTNSELLHEAKKSPNGLQCPLRPALR